MATRTTFDIRNLIDRLTPTGKRNRYFCPVCKGNDLTIDPQTGEYRCWHGCECRDIREAIAPWKDRKRQKKSKNYNPHLPPQPKKKPRPVQIPDGKIELATLPIEPKLPTWTKPRWFPKGKIGSHLNPKTLEVREYRFRYSETQWVSRFEWDDPFHPKGHDKDIRQGHTKQNGKTAWNKGENPWLPYRINEIKSHAAGKWVLGGEGEPTVETARKLTFISTTLQGSNWTPASIGSMLRLLKEAKAIGFVFIRDNDDTGINKALAIATEAAKLKFPCLIINLADHWEDCPKKGDLVDWVEAHKELSQQEKKIKMDDIIQEAAQKQRDFESGYVRYLNPVVNAAKKNNLSQISELKTEFLEQYPIEAWEDLVDYAVCECGVSRDLLSPSENKEEEQLTMEEAAERARQILKEGGLDELTLNFSLERLRRQTDLSSSFWERKVLAPLKRELNGDRFKADLKQIIQEEDQIEKLRQTSQLACKYQMPSGQIKMALSVMENHITADEYKVYDLKELYSLENEGLDWLIPGFLPKNETIILAGNPKSGKTLLTVDLAFGLVTGESSPLNEPIEGGKKILIVSADESAISTKEKLQRRGIRLQDNDNVRVITKWNLSQLAQLKGTLEEFRPDLTIIDSLKRITQGSEISENSAEFADTIYILKETLEHYKSAGILIHHSNKSPDAIGVGKIRGSSAIAGAVWGTLILDQIPKPDPKNKRKLILDPCDPKRILSLHARDSEGQRLEIELDSENNSWSVLGEVGVDQEQAKERKSISDRILKVLRINKHPLSGGEIKELLDNPPVNKGTFYTALNRLVNKKIVSSKPAPNNNRYTLYYLPSLDNGDPGQPPPNNSPTPPSPPPEDPNAIYTDSQSQPESQTSSTPPNTTNSKAGILQKSSEVLDVQNADTAKDTPIYSTYNTLTGGGGVSDSSLDPMDILQNDLARNEQVEELLSTQNQSEIEKQISEPITKDSPLEIFKSCPPSYSPDIYAKREKAIAIKTAMLNCSEAGELKKLREDSEYSQEQIDWVYRNVLTPAEKAQVDRSASKEQLSFFDLPSKENNSSPPVEEHPVDLSVSSKVLIRIYSSPTNTGVVTAIEKVVTAIADGYVYTVTRNDGVVDYFSRDQLVLIKEE